MPLCPVCQYSETSLWSTARDYEYFTSEKEYHYFSCRRCYCIFIDPVPVQELNLIYPPNYYSFVNSKRNIVTGVKEWLDARFFRKILRRLKADKLKLLDVGGGTGWLSSLIKNMDRRIATTQIVDIDEKARELAEGRGHLYFKGRLEDFTTTDKYDLILMLNLIEHVSDPLAILNKAADLLSENGVLVIKTPNTRSLDARLFRKSYWGGLHCPRHWIIFSDEAFRMITSSTPLRIDQSDYTQGGPFWAFSFIIALHRKRILRADRNRPVIFHPLFPLLSGMAAAFDFIRRPISKTSQMFIVLSRLHNQKP